MPLSTGSRDQSPGLWGPSGEQVQENGGWAILCGGGARLEMGGVSSHLEKRGAEYLTIDFRSTRGSASSFHAGRVLWRGGWLLQKGAAGRRVVPAVRVCRSSCLDADWRGIRRGIVRGRASGHGSTTPSPSLPPRARRPAGKAHSGDRARFLKNLCLLVPGPPSATSGPFDTCPAGFAFSFDTAFKETFWSPDGRRGRLGPVRIRGCSIPREMALAFRDEDGDFFNQTHAQPEISDSPSGAGERLCEPSPQPERMILGGEFAAFGPKLRPWVGAEGGGAVAR